MVRWVVGTILHGGPIDIYLVTATTGVSKEIKHFLSSSGLSIRRHLYKFLRRSWPFYFTCPAHTIDVRQDRIPSAAKCENVRID